LTVSETKKSCRLKKMLSGKLGRFWKNVLGQAGPFQRQKKCYRVS
jgi:hypothetical protein